MAGVWTRDGAVQDQIDDTVSDAVKFARSLMPAGEGLGECEECGEAIPEARRKRFPERAPASYANPGATV